MAALLRHAGVVLLYGLPTLFTKMYIKFCHSCILAGFSVIQSLQLFLHLLRICLSSRYEVLEHHSVIDDLQMKSEECPVPADADAVHGMIADKANAVGDVFNTLCLMACFAVDFLTVTSINL